MKKNTILFVILLLLSIFLKEAIEISAQIKIDDNTKVKNLSIIELGANHASVQVEIQSLNAGELDSYKLYVTDCKETTIKRVKTDSINCVEKNKYYIDYKISGLNGETNYCLMVKRNEQEQTQKYGLKTAYKNVDFELKKSEVIVDQEIIYDDKNEILLNPEQEVTVAIDVNTNEKLLKQILISFDRVVINSLHQQLDENEQVLGSSHNESGSYRVKANKKNDVYVAKLEAPRQIGNYRLTIFHQDLYGGYSNEQLNYKLAVMKPMQVVDANSGQGLSDVEIKIGKKIPNTEEYEIVNRKNNKTNKSGYYNYAYNQGDYKIEAVTDGYEQKQINVIINDPKNQEVVMELSKKSGISAFLLRWKKKMINMIKEIDVSDDSVKKDKILQVSTVSLLIFIVLVLIAFRHLKKPK